MSRFSRRVASAVVGKLERDEQQEVIAFYRGIRCEVWEHSEKRKTRVTPGYPDLTVFCERRRLCWYHETKIPSGRLSEAQLKFRALCRATDRPYVAGGLAEARAFALATGLIATVGGQSSTFGP